jgi:hypothetical protein
MGNGQNQFNSSYSDEQASLEVTAAEHQGVGGGGRRQSKTGSWSKLVRFMFGPPGEGKGGMTVTTWYSTMVRYDGMVQLKS